MYRVRGALRAASGCEVRWLGWRRHQLDTLGALVRRLVAHSGVDAQRMDDVPPDVDIECRAVQHLARGAGVDPRVWRRSSSVRSSSAVATCPLRLRCAALRCAALRCAALLARPRSAMGGRAMLRTGAGDEGPARAASPASPRGRRRAAGVQAQQQAGPRPLRVTFKRGQGRAGTRTITMVLLWCVRVVCVDSAAATARHDGARPRRLRRAACGALSHARTSGARAAARRARTVRSPAQMPASNVGVAVG